MKLEVLVPPVAIITNRAAFASHTTIAQPTSFQHKRVEMLK